MIIHRKTCTDRFCVTAVIIAASVLLWFWGLFHSPVFQPEIQQEKLQAESPELEVVKTLADAYWTRYPDIKKDKYYGKNGQMGIYGAEEHFKYHGKREGRIFGPIPSPEDPLLEADLAKAYWQRYPEIERSAVWGRNSELGIYGPRDHYHYHGQKYGRIWGPILSQKITSDD